MDVPPADSPEQLRAEIQRLRDQIAVLEARAAATPNDLGATTGSVAIPDHTLAEPSRRAREEQYRRIVETTMEGIWVIDANNITTFVNERMANILGYSIDEMLGISLFAFLKQEDLGSVTQSVARRRTGIAEQFDRCYRHKSGADVWVLLATNPLHDAEGAYSGALAMVIDITERVLAEQALRQSEARFSAAFRVSPVAFAITEAATARYIEVNSRYLQLSGYTNAELIGKNSLTIGMFVDSDDRVIMQREVTIHGTLRDYAMQARTKSGEILHVLVSITTIEVEQTACFFTVVVDITDRIRAEAVIQQAADRLQVLADASHAFASAGPNYQAMLELIAHTTAGKLRATCINRLLTSDGQWLEAATIYDQNPEVQAIVQATFAPVRVHVNAQNPAAIVVRNGQPLLVPVIDPDDLRAAVSVDFGIAFTRFRPYSAIAAPLRLHGQIIGSISFTRHEPGLPAFTEDDLRLAQDLADRAALAIGNARLYQDVQAAQRATAAALAQIDAIISNSPNGIGYLDRDLRYVLVNPALAAINRQTPAAHLGRTLAEVLPLTAVWLEPVMRKVLATGDAIRDLELHSPSNPRDGITHDWLINLYPVPEPDGEIAGIGVTVTDLTQRKHAEAALHQSEARFAKAFHSSPVGLAINRVSDGCFLDVNESFLHLIGYEHAEVVGQSWQTLQIFGDVGVIREVLFQMKINGSAQNQQIVLHTKHGDLHTVLFSAEPLVLDQQDCFISTCVNITERVRAQELVRRTADRLATIRAIDQAILKLHAPATIANAVVGNIRTLIPCQYASVMLYDTASAQAQILTFRSELPLAMPINTPFPLDALPDGFLNGAPWVAHDLLNDAAGERIHPLIAAISTEPIGALLSIPLLVEWQMIGTLNLAATLPGTFTAEHVTIAQEIGDMLAIALHNARLVESLQQELAARARAEVALTAEHARVVRLKNEFMATMSHELRTPLAAVLGRAELLIEGVYEPLNERQTVAMQTIAQSGKHLLVLINDILDYAKFEAGQIALALSETMVVQICRDSISLIGQAALAKRIAPTSTLDAAVITIMADQRRLQQILVNLLENAIKFTPKGGEVGLEVHGDLLHEQVTFAVWDTGIGIAEADLPQLFQPFTQLDSSLSRQYEGTGLGLALVRRLTEAHGGSVTVISTPGSGSRFTITLPWHPNGLDAADLAEPIPTLRPVVDRIERSKGANSSPAPLILLVEDRESNIALLEDALPSYGYQVVVARDGHVALMRARETRPALILMDIQLPGLSGIDVIQQIRADPHLRQIPIIALTALVLPGDRERCLDAGADEYLAKPVSLRMLLATIADQLAHTRT